MAHGGYVSAIRIDDGFFHLRACVKAAISSREQGERVVDERSWVLGAGIRIGKHGIARDLWEAPQHALWHNSRADE